MACLATLGWACSPGAAQQTGTALGTVRGVAGTTTLSRDGEKAVVNAPRRVVSGDLISVGRNGLAELRLGKSNLQLRAAGIVVQSSNRLRIKSGSLLAREVPAMTILMPSSVKVTGRGTLRADVSSDSGRVATYEAQGVTVTASQPVPLPGYWQLALGPAGPGEAKPVQFSARDSWDAELLATALSVDFELENVLRGLEPQLAATPPEVLQQHLVASGIPAQALAPFSASPRSAVLLALAFAREWKKERPMELAAGFSQLLALRTLGASWGLLAQQLNVEGTALLMRLQEEVGRLLVSEPGGFPTPSRLISRPQAVQSPSAVSGHRAAAPSSAPAMAPAPGPVGQPPGGPPGVLQPVPEALRPLLPPALELVVDDLYGIVHTLVPIL